MLRQELHKTLWDQSSSKSAVWDNEIQVTFQEEIVHSGSVHNAKKYQTIEMPYERKMGTWGRGILWMTGWQRNRRNHSSIQQCGRILAKEWGMKKLISKDHL